MKSLIFLVPLAFVSINSAYGSPVLIGHVESSPGIGKIGVQISRTGKVLKVHPLSPADSCGLIPGDKIIAVDGKPGDVDHIHGLPNSMVTLVIKRGEDQFERTIERINEHLISPYGSASSQVPAGINQQL